MELIFYLSIKFVVYSVLMFIGFRHYNAPANWDVLYAAALGFVRVSLGFLFAVVTFFGAAMFFASSIYSFTLFLLPARYLSWTVMTKLIYKTEPYPKNKYWILSGVVLSSALDLIVYYFVPNPAGRWFC